MPIKDRIDKDIGSSYAWCAGWVGIGLAVYGIVYAVLAYAGFDQPFGVAAIGMVLAVTGYYALAALWFIVRAFKKLNVVLLAISAGLTVFFSIRSVIIPVVERAPGKPFGAALVAVLIHSPAAPIFLVVTAVLAAGLIKKVKN